MLDAISTDLIVSHYNYWMTIILMMVGLYVVVSRGNLVKKIVGLNLFQTSVFMLYISMGKILGGTAPILTDNPDEVYSNPLPHVLILTAIVVGVATTALGLALIVRIREQYNTIEEDEIFEIELKLAAQASKTGEAR
ncbi:MAG: cation:proton antiporter subunit C [Alphaproteobacteria bacterium]|nr:Na+/H+ antiporter subunit C [Rhodobiaceae bacterium]MBO6542255.1 cation:proton antiporter subunit C [Alphaproteobacteria bacterium]MBO6629108.1 cation:proton antiporter subunit C [Alphaproteobacteria bacterium]MDF1624889.1 cation:proton antiporter subunit C [Parvibaculaceae bacterium]|tara:strand:+ start:178 stop:588 length:411 start_codon:yes stop_codon:yes gene_type:complete